MWKRRQRSSGFGEKEGAPLLRIDAYLCPLRDERAELCGETLAHGAALSSPARADSFTDLAGLCKVCCSSGCRAGNSLVMMRPLRDIKVTNRED